MNNFFDQKVSKIIESEKPFIKESKKSKNAFIKSETNKYLN